MKKFIPYLYFIFAIIILVDAFQQFFADKEIYRILFSWRTESKYLFLGVKAALALLFITSGISSYKKIK